MAIDPSKGCAFRVATFCLWCKDAAAMSAPTAATPKEILTADFLPGPTAEAASGELDVPPPPEEEDEDDDDDDEEEEEEDVEELGSLGGGLGLGL